ncbi:MAG: 1-acyl-sn-glycerol-3-phosphate acyltransferase [Parachlamydiaceae bacterium]
MDSSDFLHKAVLSGKIPEELAIVIRNFYLSYHEAIAENGYTAAQVQPLLDKFLQLLIQQLEHPHVFEPFHKRIKSPFDYYHFGLDFIRPLIVFSRSTVQGIENLDAIEAALAKGENVILLANHQTEPDPQAISLLLEKTHPKLAEEMIFVAGHRVITDPLAVPLSMGRNLLCIFSKRHIETEPEFKSEKLNHNQKTMKIMTQLLREGGKCIYVAPSGGRDRPSLTGAIEVAKFDPQSIEMFCLIAQQSGRKTHFHPLALATYDLLPPPNSIEKQLGERRHAHCTPIHLSFCKSLDMQHFPGSDHPDKRERRQNRADYIWGLVVSEYSSF